MLDQKRSFRKRLQDDDLILCAGGYLFEAERRGYLTAGIFVPELSLEQPEVLLQITRDFIHAGSDVSLAFTYNCHREKMRVMGKEYLLEPLNRAAIQIAKKSSQDFRQGEKPLVAGNISNSGIFQPNDPDREKEISLIFREVCEWSADEGVDFIQAETFYYVREAEIALQEIKRVGLPSVVMCAVPSGNQFRDGISIIEGMERLVEQGVEIIGLNCFRGPNSLLPLIAELRGRLKVPLAAMPVAYRTTLEHPTFFDLPDRENTAVLPNRRTFPDALESQVTNRYEIADFGQKARSLGCRYIGLCCGNQPMLMRQLTESLGRDCPASHYRPNISHLTLYGEDETF